jgi:hypothetical protein
VAGKRAEGLLEMMLFIELYTLNRAWSGLTDEELLWVPMPGAWTVQPRDKCHTATPFVVGAWADVGALEPAYVARHSDASVHECGNG